MLRCIAGLESISEGELRIGDRRVNEVHPKDRDVAMVFQSYALYPHMTVRQNIAFPLKIRGDSAQVQQDAVAEAARMLSLEPLLDRLPGQLSGGQRQRVAMGRAIVRRPSVFLFDEPLSNLDAALRTQMRVELKRLHRTLATTVVHVTHDQVEALTLADRLCVLNMGVVQQFGSPREVFDRPANTFVATFIGSPSMNLMAAQADGDSARLEGVDEPLAVRIPGDCTLGIRPTDLRLNASRGPTATVDLVESLGAEAIVHLVVGPHRMLAQVAEPCGVSVGDEVVLGAEVVHCFDLETGVRLETGSA